MNNKQLGLLRVNYETAFVLDPDEAVSVMRILNNSVNVKVDYNGKIRKIIDSDEAYPTLSWIPEQTIKEAQLQKTLTPDE